jgi:hypothetical protein
MASVQLISNRWFVPVDANSVILWINEGGRLEYALYGHFEGRQPCAEWEIGSRSVTSASCSDGPGSPTQAGRKGGLGRLLPTQRGGQLLLEQVKEEALVRTDLRQDYVIAADADILVYRFEMAIG